MLHLESKTIGKLLRLAEAQKDFRKKDKRSVREKAADSLRDLKDRCEGAFERSTPERDIECFLTALADEEKREVIALFYFGRDAVDDFAYTVAHPRMSLTTMPQQLSDKTDLADSLIAGLKRLADQATGGSDKV
jgi:hypothetical protein